MNTQIFAATRYLNVENDTEITFFELFALLSDSSICKEWAKDMEVRNNFGDNQLEVLFKNPYFFYDGDLSDIPDLYTTYADTHDFFVDRFIFTINSLWFIKDNSINIDSVFISDKDEDIYLSTRTTFMNTSSEGLFENTTFLPADFQEAANLSSRINYIMPSLMGNQANRWFDGGAALSAINYIDHKTHNRVARAFMFLNKARQQSYLPVKISFYIACLEALFTTDNSEVTHKIRERAACFIARNDESKIDVFDEIKRAYDVRSNYMHGGRIKKFDELTQISKSMDGIVRSVFIKLLDHFPIFVNVEKDFIDYNPDILSKVFNDMVLTGKIGKPDSSSSK